MRDERHEMRFAFFCAHHLPRQFDDVFRIFNKMFSLLLLPSLGALL